MFGIGFPELLFVLLLAVLILGPEHMPKAAQMLGRWSAKMRSAATSLSQAVAEDENLREIHESVSVVRKDIAQTKSELLGTLEGAGNTVREAREELKTVGRISEPSEPEKPAAAEKTAESAISEQARVPEASDFMSRPLRWFEDEVPADETLRVIRLKNRIMLPGPVSRLVSRRSVKLDAAGDLGGSMDRFSLASPQMKGFCRIRRISPAVMPDASCTRHIRLLPAVCPNELAVRTAKTL